MVHLFDYAYKEDVSLIETLSNTYGKVKGIPLQKPDTVEPRYNEPRYSEDPIITNNI